MPVIGTPTTPVVLTKDDVRGFLRDYPVKVPNTGVENILFDLPEFSDADIDRAVKFTVSGYNSLNPIIGTYTVETMTPYIMLLGVAAFLMRSEAFRQLRNQMTYQGGDVTSGGLDDKQALYMGLSQAYQAEFDEKARAEKTVRNMSNAYGHLRSGYAGGGRRWT